MILDFSNNTSKIDFELFHESWQKAILDFLKEYSNNNPKIDVMTSGSTGEPKTISILKKHMRNSALMTGKTFNLRKGQTALLCLPIHYIAGKMMLVRAVELQLKLICVLPTGNPLKDISTSIDFCAMVPLQVEKSLSKLTIVKQLIIGGAAISESLEKKLKNIKTLCFATYGMTETVTHIAIKPLNHSLKSIYYTVLKGISIAKDQRNCLVIDCPELNSQKVMTNDIVELVNETQFQFLGRLDNVINSGGVKIHSESVEKKLSSIISERFFIASIPDEKLGEKVVLVIEKENPDFSLNLELYLAPLEVPKRIFFIKKLIETTNGKIKRKETLDRILS